MSAHDHLAAEWTPATSASHWRTSLALCSRTSARPRKRSGTTKRATGAPCSAISIWLSCRVSCCRARAKQCPRKPTRPSFGVCWPPAHRRSEDWRIREAGSGRLSPGAPLLHARAPMCSCRGAESRKRHLCASGTARIHCRRRPTRAQRIRSRQGARGLTRPQRSLEARPMVGPARPPCARSPGRCGPARRRVA